MALMKSALAWLKDYVEAIKHGRLHPFTQVERKTRAATRDEPWGPTGVQLNELALLSHDEVDAHIIFAVLERRLLSHGERWRHVYKSLQVIEFLVKRGHDRCPVMATPLLGLLHSLATGFAYIAPDGKDYGANIRIRSAAVAAVVEDLPSLWGLREQLAERMKQHYQEWVAAPLSPTHPVNEQAPDVVPSQRLVYDGMQEVLSATSKPSTGSSTPAPINTSGAPVNHKAAITPETARQLSARLTQLMARSDNKFCADCAAHDPAARANWASVTCGVFLCLKCAGIHRGLGTHISQVRSVNLDTWLPHQVDLMEAAGNGPANQYYEAVLPAGQRPARDSPAMAAFIREKYANKRWANPLATWPPALPGAPRADTGSPASGGSRTLTASPLSTGGATPVSSAATTSSSPAAHVPKQGATFGRAVAPSSARPAPATTTTTATRRAVAPASAATAGLGGGSTTARLANTSGPTQPGAVAWHTTPPRTAPPPAVVQPQPDTLAASHDEAVLIDLSDEEEDARDVAARYPPTTRPPVLMDPAMGVLEWLDAQHMSGHGIPATTCIPAGPLSPAGPSTFMPTSPLLTGGNPTGHVTHVVLTSGGPPAWVPSYTPPHPSNPTTPLSTPLTLSGTFTGGMLAGTAMPPPPPPPLAAPPPGMYPRALAAPGYLSAGPTGGAGLPGAAPPPQGMPPHLVALAAHHVMVNGPTGPHLVFSGPGGVVPWYPTAVTGGGGADDQVATALDELAEATVVASPLTNTSPVKEPAPGSSGPTGSSYVSENNREAAESNGGLTRTGTAAGFGSTQLPSIDPLDLLDSLPAALPSPASGGAFRNDDPFRASVLPFQPIHSPSYQYHTSHTRRTASPAGRAPVAPTGLRTSPAQPCLSPGKSQQVLLTSPRGSQPQHSQPSLDDMVKGLVGELDATLSTPTAVGAELAAGAALPAPAQLLASCSLPLPANPLVQKQARNRLAAAGVAKPVSLPKESVGQPMHTSMTPAREGALGQAMIKGRWHTQEQYE